MISVAWDKFSGESICHENMKKRYLNQNPDLEGF